jgi:hypothetical protein
MLSAVYRDVNGYCLFCPGHFNEDAMDELTGEKAASSAFAFSGLGAFR